MSRSSQTIEMHFKEILAITERIGSLAKELGRIGNEALPDAVYITKRGWNSACAQKLMARELKAGDQIREEAEHLKNLAEEMKKQAEEMYRMEQINSQLAVTRIY